MKKLFLTILLTIGMLTAQIAVGAPVTSLSREEIPTAAAPSVSIDGVIIEMRNPHPEPVKFQIFSITGQLIKSVVVKSAPVRIELPKGFYIVKCDNWTKRVMLK